MIISRTPLRVSFFGGGTDYPQWYNEHGGDILGTSIDKYCYVMLHNGESWFTFDLPNKSGLATSSAYTVGLLRVCSELDKYTIAKIATTWEYDKMGGNVGSQDQYLCAVGGFHHLKFSEHGIRDIPFNGEIEELQNYLMLFDTHQYRRAGDIVAKQLAEIKENEPILKDMMGMVSQGVGYLKEKDYESFGELLGIAWKAKKHLAGVSTPEIDRIYDLALRSGATSGKLLGAGGGGFILFFVQPDKQKSVRKALSDLSYVPFKFETEGTKVIYRD